MYRLYFSKIRKKYGRRSPPAALFVRLFPCNDHPTSTHLLLRHWLPLPPIKLDESGRTQRAFSKNVVEFLRGIHAVVGLYSPSGRFVVQVDMCPVVFHPSDDRYGTSIISLLFPLIFLFRGSAPSRRMRPGLNQESSLWAENSGHFCEGFEVLRFLSKMPD